MTQLIFHWKRSAEGDIINVHYHFWRRLTRIDSLPPLFQDPRSKSFLFTEALNGATRLTWTREYEKVNKKTREGWEKKFKPTIGVNVMEFIALCSMYIHTRHQV